MLENSSEEQTIKIYRKYASEHGLEPSSTMLDRTTREMEVSVVLSCLTHISGTFHEDLNVLDVGCGNGYLLKEIRSRFPKVRLAGIDYSPDMVKLAAQRKLASCEIRRGDVRSLKLNESAFDVVISERCLINLLNPAEQDKALQEINRVLKPLGYFILIENFTDALENLNCARTELGLDENTMPRHNLWLDKSYFLASAERLFHIWSSAELEAAGLPPSNLLSSYYFISRVLYPCITKKQVMYNTEFVRFFKFLPPMGNYSPIQFFLLRKPV